MRLLSTSTCALSLLFFTACSTTQPDPATPAPDIFIQPETILPTSFQKASAPETDHVFRIPEHALGVGIVSRPKAELRQGPGLQFELEDTLLPQGTRVIVIDHSKIWRRVFAPELKAWGWVHHKTLTIVKQETGVLTFEAQDLPKVFAVRPIETAYNFENLSELKVSIPRGAGFLKVRERGGKVLVILPETRSLLWLAKKDVP